MCKTPLTSVVEQNAAVKLQNCSVDFDTSADFISSGGGEEEWVFMFGWTAPLAIRSLSFSAGMNQLVVSALEAHVIIIISPHRIRVEFHVAWLGHALPCVHLLDASPQVVPYLVQAYLSQSVGVLGPVWRHRSARSSPLPTEQCPPFPAPVSVAPPAPLLGWFLSWLALLSECAVHLAAAAALQEAGRRMWDGMQSHSARLGGAVCHSST